MNPALRFLIWRSFVGGLRHKLARLKQPKYSIPTVFSLLYFTGIMLPHLLSNHSPGNGLRFFVPMGIAYLVATLAFTWAFQPQKIGLNLTEAEAEMLLAAPLSRREILNYYVLKAQPGILFLSLIIGTLFPIIMGAPSRPVLIITLFLIINFIRTFGLMVSFLWPALTGSVWHWPLRLGGTFYLLLSGYLGMSSLWTEGLDGVNLFFIHIPAELVAFTKYAPHTIISAGFAATPLLALPGWTLLVLFICTSWLLTPRFNVAFEENALLQAQRRAERIARRSGIKSNFKPEKERTRVWLPLKTHGAPWIGLVWKNAMRLFRNEIGPLLAGTLALMILVLIYLLITGNSSGLKVLAIISAPWMLITALILPALLRMDFRGEMDQMELVKTLPISSRQMLAVMVGFTTLITVGVQLIILAITLVALIYSHQSPGSLTIIAVSALFALPTLTFTLVVVENCLILWFPAWFAFRTQGSGRGFDFMGRRIISMIARFLGLGVLLLIPGGATLLLGFGLMIPFGLWGWPLAIAMGSLLLITEVTLIGGNVATLYERLEPGSAELT